MASIFAQSTKEVVSQVVPDFVPCPSLSVATREVGLLRLVTRKRRTPLVAHLKGPWKHVVQSVGLKDIVTSSDGVLDAADVSKVKKTHFAKFTYSADSQISGSASVKVPETLVEAEIGLEVTSEQRMNSEQLQLNMVSYDVTKLREELRNRSLDQNNDLWKQFSEAKASRKQLCVIVDMLQIENAVVLQSNKKLAVKAQALLEKILQAAFSWLLIDTKTRSLELPAGTKMAYRVLELKIEPNSHNISIPYQTKSEPESMDPNATLIYCENGDLKNLYYNDEVKKCKKYCDYFSSLDSPRRTSLSSAILQNLQKFHRQTSDDAATDDANADKELKRLKCLVKSALPTHAEPHSDEIRILLRELNLQDTFLGLPEENDVVYGIRVFVTALSNLQPNARIALSNCKDAGNQLIRELENVLQAKCESGTYVATGAIPVEVRHFLSAAGLDTCDIPSQLLYTWRAAYLAAHYIRQ